jgi:hypothetical protein
MKPTLSRATKDTLTVEEMLQDERLEFRTADGSETL